MREGELVSQATDGSGAGGQEGFAEKNSFISRWRQTRRVVRIKSAGQHGRDEEKKKCLKKQYWMNKIISPPTQNVRVLAGGQVLYFLAIVCSWLLLFRKR